MFVGWARDCYYRTRGIVRDVMFTGTRKNHTVFRRGAVGIVSTLLRAETWGACRARVQHSAELCFVVVCCGVPPSGVVAQSPCDGYLLHVVFPLHRFPACSPDRSRTGSTAQWDF